jgi:photosystem II stability/assembly factor-like uncharacterized protein
MKSKLINIFLLILIVLSAPVKAQDWTIMDISVTHTNAPLNGIYFTNDSTGYVVGAYDFSPGVILKTTNAGATWTLTNVPYGLLSVYFPSKDTGYATGYHSTIMKTVDAGNTWVTQNTSFVSSAYWANAVCFINNDTGFVSMKNGPGYAFLKTYNGGTTWFNDISDTIYIEDFSLVKPRTLFAINNKLAKTTDNGATWTKKALPPNGYSYSVFFVNDTLGYATFSGMEGPPCFNYASFLRTTDAGTTWTSIDYPCEGAGMLFFPTAKIGYSLGGGNPSPGIHIISKTTDGGITWNYTNYPLSTTYDTTNDGGRNIFCTDSNTCYIITNVGVIIKTTNGGGAVGINESHIENETLKIYPNPATNQITIEFDLAETKNIFIEIKNVLGQTVQTISNSFSQGTNKIEIDVSNFSEGIYFVQLQSGNKIVYQKFIKE